MKTMMPETVRVSTIAYVTFAILPRMKVGGIEVGQYSDTWIQGHPKWYNLVDWMNICVKIERMFDSLGDQQQYIPEEKNTGIYIYNFINQTISNHVDINMLSYDNIYHEMIVEIAKSTGFMSKVGSSLLLSQEQRIKALEDIILKR
jgi:hypothetical protein